MGVGTDTVAGRLAVVLQDVVPGWSASEAKSELTGSRLVNTTPAHSVGHGDRLWAALAPRGFGWREGISSNDVCTGAVRLWAEADRVRRTDCLGGMATDSGGGDWSDISS